jgi:competence protein ComGC
MKKKLLNKSKNPKRNNKMGDDEKQKNNKPEHEKTPSQKLAEEILANVKGQVVDSITDYEKKNSPLDRIEDVINAREAHHDNIRRKEKIFTLSIAAIILIVTLTIMFLVVNSQIKEKKKINTDTKIQLQTLLDVQKDEYLHGKIVKDLEKLIETHRNAVIRFQGSHMWKKEYSKKELHQMASEIISAWKERNIKPELIYAWMSAENNFKFWETSPAGAEGLMQTMPSVNDNIKTSRWYYKNLNPFDPSDSIILGSEYMVDVKTMGLKTKPKKHTWIYLDTACGYNGGPTWYSRYLNEKYNNKNPEMWTETYSFREKMEFYYTNYTADQPNYSVVWRKQNKTNK